MERGENENSHVVEICSVVVHPHHRRKGFAFKMLEAMLKRICENEEYQSITRVELLVETDNEKAPYLYQKLGFKYEITYDDLLRRYSGPREGQWFTGTMFMYQLLSKQLIVRPLPDPTIEVVDGATCDEFELVCSNEKHNLHEFVISNPSDGKQILSLSCQQLGRRLSNMGIIKDVQYDAQYSLQFIANLIQSLLPELHKLGIRHLQIQVPEGCDAYKKLFVFSGFDNKGLLHAKYQPPGEGFFTNTLVYETRLFNLTETLECLQTSTGFDRVENKQKIVEVIERLQVRLNELELAPTANFHIANNVYHAVDIIANKPIPKFVKRSLANEQSQMQLESRIKSALTNSQDGVLNTLLLELSNELKLSIKDCKQQAACIL